MDDMKADTGTCLSPAVYRLLCEDGVARLDVDEAGCQKAVAGCQGVVCCEGGVSCCQQDDVGPAHCSQEYLTDSGLLDWDAVKRLVPDLEGSSRSYTEIVCRLRSVLLSVKSFLEKLTVEQFSEQYRDYLTWTDNAQLCVRSFETLREERKSSGMLSLLLSSAVLERALGDLFLTKGRQCPSLLKDLLVTAELRTVLGEFVVEFLRVLIGPPTSLNLRNLVWHGFPSPQELDIQYSFMLLMLITSLGQLIHRNRTVHMGPIPHRTPVNFSGAKHIVQHFTVQFPLHSQDELRELCLHSDFILPQFVPVWIDAFDIHNESRYGEGVCLLFPLLENGLRLMFARLNGCPQRILTAESSVLYTTFDEILCPELPDGTTNKLFHSLSQPLLDLLQDLLVLPEGPRFRDRLSHGEARIQDISEAQAASVWMVAFGLLYTFTSPSSKIWQSPSVKTFIAELENYVSVFHPVSLLVEKILNLTRSLSEWESCIRFDPNLNIMSLSDIWSDSWGGNSQYTFLLDLCQGRRLHELLLESIDVKKFLQPGEKISSAVSEVLRCERMSVLRRLLTYSGKTSLGWNSDSQDATCHCTMEEISLFRRTVGECLTICDNVRQSLVTRQPELGGNQLRSRQRDTIKRMLNSLPILSVGIRCVLVVILSKLTHSESSEHFNIKFLKAMLKYCENMRTYTTMDKNKWSESVELSYKFIQRFPEGDIT